MLLKNTVREPTSFRPVVAQAVPYPVLFASITGAHLYGFPSPESDVDLRGCHLLPLAVVIGLDQPHTTLNRTWQVDGTEIDLVSHDVRKFVSLLLQQHGNYLEQLFSPLVVVDTPWAAELRELARGGGITRQVYHPYAGYAKGQWLAWRKQALVGQAAIKPLLYAYRVSLTGLHLLRTGEINANLAQLAPVYGYSHLLDLIAAKTAEHVAIALPVEEHDAALTALQERLHDAYLSSPLPQEVRNRPALNDFVVRVRLAS